MKKINKILGIGIGVASLVLGLAGPISAFAFTSPATVDLGTAGSFAILSKAGITTTGVTSITGDIGVSPIDSTAIVGFGLILDSSSQFSTSAIVTGKVYASNYAEPTPTNLGVAILNMHAAYLDALSRSTTDPAEINPGSAGEIGGLTLTPGVYTFTGAVAISTDLTLSGGANDIWIFQIPGTFSVHANVILSPGVQAKNIFWAVADATTIFPGFTVNGNIITAEPKTIALQAGAVLNGRALSQGAVTLITSTVTVPTTSAPAPAAVFTLTATPTSTIVNKSALVSATDGIPTSNSAVGIAVNGLTPIAVTLANTGNADSATNVRISPIGASSHIQLWAKDSTGNWRDINVTGWITNTAGISMPAGYSTTTDVYVISDQAGSYPLTANLVKVSDSSTVASATETVTVKNIPTASTLTYIVKSGTATSTHTISGPDGSGVYNAGSVNVTNSLEKLSIVINNANTTSTITNVFINGTDYTSEAGSFWSNNGSSTWSTTVSAGYPFSTSPYKIGLNTLTSTFTDSTGGSVTLTLR